MDDITPIWRPRQSVRAVAIGLPFRGDRILVSAVTDDDATVKGWRPLGGGVEFGEAAEMAVLREFREELDAKARTRRQIGVIENIFEHQGVTGHEVVFVFELALDDPGQARADRFIMEDSGHRNVTAWKALADFTSGRDRLLPDGLLGMIEGLVPGSREP